jgi:methionyl-tRNA formyltransferase
VREAAGWREAHRHSPGALVHTARDGFVQITGWSALPPESARDTGR